MAGSDQDALATTLVTTGALTAGQLRECAAVAGESPGAVTAIDVALRRGYLDRAQLAAARDRLEAEPARADALRRDLAAARVALRQRLATREQVRVCRHEQLTRQRRGEDVTFLQVLVDARCISEAQRQVIATGVGEVLAHGRTGGAELARQPHHKAAAPAPASKPLRGVLAHGRTGGAELARQPHHKAAPPRRERWYVGLAGPGGKPTQQAFDLPTLQRAIETGRVPLDAPVRMGRTGVLRTIDRYPQLADALRIRRARDHDRLGRRRSDRGLYQEYDHRLARRARVRRVKVVIGCLVLLALLALAASLLPLIRP